MWSVVGTPLLDLGTAEVVGVWGGHIGVAGLLDF